MCSDVSANSPDRDAALFAAAAGSPYAEALARHWLQAAGDRIAPRKSDFRPELMGRFLTRVIIYEYENPGVIRFRLAGTYFREIHGRELTGTNFLDLMQGKDRQNASSRLFGMTGWPCGVHTINTSQHESGHPGEFRSFGLPITDNDGRFVHSIHVSDFLGDDAGPDPGKIRSMGAISSHWIDIGAGVPATPPPV